MTQPPLMFRVGAAIRNGYHFHGPKFPFVILHRAGLYAYRKLFGPKQFELGGQTHRYMVHPLVLDNERAVEIPIARDFLRGRTGEILEVGNVLSNYCAFAHDVVDKYEKAPGVMNEDIVTYAPGKKYDVIVTISTLEHVGWDEQPREPEKLARAIACLKELLAPGGELIATLPLGYNPTVDQMLREGRTGFSKLRFLKRVSGDNAWKEARFEEVKDTKFGHPYSCANAIVIGYESGPPR
jgi:SAM-dependent methyltransferase